MNAPKAAPSAGRPGWVGSIEAGLARMWWRSEPTATARLLQPLAALYGLLAERAAQGARRSRARRVAASVPVVVVGNVVVGGAGKTPAVLALVQAFQQAGRSPGVVARGYGRSGTSVREVQASDAPAQVGDEALLLCRRARVPVWVARDRAAAVAALCAAHPEVDLIVSDDGLQHHGLARAAELLVFDDRGIGNGLLLPAGPLRQPLPASLLPRQRVLYSGSRASTALPGLLGRRSLSRAWPLSAWLAVDASAAIDLQTLADRPLLAVAGLAAPESYFTMLEASGLRIQRLPLPDHHPYTTLPWPPETADVVTTEKDAVKLDPTRIGSTRVWVLPLDFQLPPGLAADLLSLLPPPQPTPPP